MIANSKSLIEIEVDRLFGEMNAVRGDYCINPVTGGSFIWEDDPIGPQKELAGRALFAHEMFALEAPLDAPPLPLSHNEIERYRNARGLAGLVGLYARSLSREGYGRRAYDVCNHPSFDDFARGLMAINTGMWGIENDEDLKRRFPPRPLEGMTPSAFWAPPEEYEKLTASYRRTRPAA